MLNELRRFIARFSHSQPRAVPSEPAPPAGVMALEFDPMWHGDHWQNLLSCPMDARHYVMEDWNVAAQPDWDETDHGSKH